MSPDRPQHLLGAPGSPGVSDSARELTTVAASEEYEGKRQEWTAILEGEIGKAREIQADYPALRHRELEQAVFATFLHSQPIGQRALFRDLMLAVGPTRPDKIELENALRRWTETSWFLDEGAISDREVAPDGRRQLPKSWRLGSKPNLRQMHSDARNRVLPDLVDAKLLDDVGRLKSLTAGAAAAGARVHNLPEKPRNVDDDGEFWEEVRNKLTKDIDPIREATLAAHLDAARRRIPDAIRQAYCIVVTVSEKNEVQAFKLTPSDDSLFAAVKADKRSRIQETAVSSEALLPEGPYNLWRDGETARRVKDLVGAFAQFPHLPKMLSRSAILETIVQGCREGHFVLRATRPDRSTRTLWRQEPDEADLKDPGLEVVLPESGTLTEIAAALLTTGALPELWAASNVRVKDLRSYFDGSRVVRIKKNGYEEPVRIPKAEIAVVDAAVRSAVETGRLWLLSGPASLLAEEIPAGVLTDEAVLLAPPSPIAVYDILPERLPDAWEGLATTALGVSLALSKALGRTLPWPTVRDGIDGALRVGLVQRAVDSGAWPCDYASAMNVKLRLKSGVELPPPPPPPPAGQLVAEAELTPAQLQDLADVVGTLASAAAGHRLGFRLRVELGDETPPPEGVVEKVSRILREVSKDLDLG